MTPVPSTRLLTLLFTDIEGSTQLWEKQPEAMRAALARHDTLLRECYEARQGQVFKTVGDAFYVAFESPLAAVTAAAASQQLLYHESWGTVPLKVRMALHSGEVETRDNDYFGPPLNRVARLLSAGHGGQVLLSAAVADQLADQFPPELTLRDMGERRLKDLSLPEHIYQLNIAGLPSEFAPLRTLDIRPTNLPAALTSFIGRQREIADLRRLLPQSRLITLTGVGGTGKTRLALQVASTQLDDYAGGVWLVELAPVTQSESVPQVLAAALALPEAAHQPLLETLVEFLAPRATLLILDNCEHLIQACAQLATTLLHRCPRLRILATSREALSVAGETTWSVPSLAPPPLEAPLSPNDLSQNDAVRLFVDRAQAVQPGFNLDSSNALAVVQICARLDGIPLALELAAARIRGMSARQIADRIEDRFRLLTGGSRTALERHQTLRATLDWSYNLLTRAEQTLFRRLSVFVGGWTLDAAEAICADPHTAGLVEQEMVADLLDQLINKSIVIHQATDNGSRYHLLETLRQYAQHKFFDTDEVLLIRHQHLRYFREVAESIEPRLEGLEQARLLEQMELNTDNFRAALRWGLERDLQEGVRLTAALWLFWFMHAHFQETARWYQEALSLAEPLEARLKMKLLVGAASNAMGRGDQEQLEAYSRQSLALAHELGDSWGAAMSQHHYGVALIARGDYAAAETLLQAALKIARAAGLWAVTGYLLSDLMELAISRDDLAQAEQYYTQAVALTQERPNPWSAAYQSIHLAGIAYSRGHYAESIRLAQRTARLALELGDRRLCVSALDHLGANAHKQQRGGRAITLWCAAIVQAAALAIQPQDRSTELADLEKELGNTAFAAAREQGRSLSLEQAVQFALEMTS